MSTDGISEAAEETVVAQSDEIRALTAKVSEGHVATCYCASYHPPMNVDPRCVEWRRK